MRESAEVARFGVWIVDDTSGRRAGLSAFAPLSDEQGLILAFDSPARACIWNQPVNYAIDVAYLDAAGAVVAVEHFEARETTSRCHNDVLDVLETRAGRLENVRLGDQMQVDPAVR